MKKWYLLLIIAFILGFIFIFSMMGPILGQQLLRMPVPVPNNVPIGTIMMYAGLPDEQWLNSQGWMICNGRSLRQDSYRDLYSVIRGGFGQSGDQFNIPDCRGVFIRGVDDSRGKDPDNTRRYNQAPGGNTGNRVGTMQNDGLRSHKHFVGYKHHRSFDGANDTDKPIKDTRKYNGDQAYNTQSFGDSETRPVNLSLYYIIKFRNN